MSFGELSTTFGIDTSEFNAPIEQSAAIAEQSGERVIRIIEEQHGSWLNFTTAVVGATGKISAALINYAAVQAEIFHDSTWLELAYDHWYVLTGLVTRYGTTVMKVASQAIPQLRALAIATTVGLAAYEIGTTTAVRDALRLTQVNQVVSESYSRLSTEVSNAGQTLSRSLGDAREMAGEFAGYVIANWTPLPAIVKSFTDELAGGMNNAADAIQWTSESFTTLQDRVTAITLSLAEFDSGGRADHYQEEAAALRKMSSEFERFIALQASHQSSFTALAEMQATAEQAALYAQEREAIGLAKTEEEINNLRVAYQQLFADRIAGLAIGESLTEAEISQQRQLLTLIEAQALGISTGRIKPSEAMFGGGGDFGESTLQIDGSNAAAQAYEQAATALNRLKFGQEEAARMAIQAMDATDEEVIALLALHDETVALTKAKKDQEEADKAAQKAAEDQDKLAKTAAERIAKLRGEIDVLTGAATKGEVALQQLVEQGFTEEQAVEIAALTDELESLQKQKQGGKQGANKAAQAASSEAVAILTRSPELNSVDNKMLSIQEKSLVALNKIANKKPDKPFPSDEQEGKDI